MYVLVPGTTGTGSVLRTHNFADRKLAYIYVYALVFADGVHVHVKRFIDYKMQCTLAYTYTHTAQLVLCAVSSEYSTR